MGQQIPLPEKFGRRLADRIPAAALLERAVSVIRSSDHPEGGNVPKALADSKNTALKSAMKDKKLTAPKHENGKFAPHPDDPFGLVAKRAGKTVDAVTGRVVESGLGNDAGTTDSENSMSKTPAKQASHVAKGEPSAEDKATIAKAKAEAKEREAKIKAEQKAAKDAEKKAAAEAAAKAKKEAADKRAQEAAARREQKEAERAQQLAGTNRSYTGPMLALAERVKQGVYVKGAHGQLRSTDDLAIALDCVTPSNVVQLAKMVFATSENPYSHLNVGQQSMNWRNRLRGAIRKGLEVPDGAGGTRKVTLDLIKEIRDANGLVTEPAPKTPRAPKAPKPAAEAKDTEHKAAPAPTLSHAAATNAHVGH